MRQIGFKMNDEVNDDAMMGVVDGCVERSATATEILRKEGMALAAQHLQHYFTPGYKPLLRGAMRDAWCMDVLSKIRDRYFSNLDM